MQSNDIALTDMEEYLRLHQEKELLRLVVVGSVDDGKSTLIGRLLHDTHGVYEDQLSAVKRASSQNGMAIDFSLFTDGLKAEREQGITIDVAYRYFSTEKRKFIVADTPGHVQYTRNMATGASTANVGLILIDARLGVLQQSRRHAYIASLLGIPHLAVAVNKMDLVEHGQQTFERIRAEFGAFCKNLTFKDVRFIPVSALRGDNVVERSAELDWYDGPTILRYLEEVPIARDRNLDDFRYPVQYVLRPHLDYRGFAAQIASGVIRRGDSVMVLPSRKLTRVSSVDTYEGALPEAMAPMSVTLTLEDEVDVSRGDMLVRPDNVPSVGERFEAMLVWLNERGLDTSKSYLLKHTTQLVRAEVEEVLHKVDLDRLSAEPSDTLGLNDIGRVRVRSRRPLFFDPYTQNRATGAFILIDALTNATLAAGMIEPSSGAVVSLGAASREAASLEAQEGGSAERSQVSARERRRRLGQRGGVVLITGSAGAGKSELAYAVERVLYDRGHVALVADPEDALAESAAGEPPAASPSRGTRELARRAREVGLVVLLPFASPEREERALLRAAVGAEHFVEVFVSTPSAAHGARASHDASAPRYEPPQSPDIELDRSKEPLERAAQRVVSVLEARGLLRVD